MKPHNIIINGQKVKAYNDVYTYRGIVELAGLPLDRLYTITYRRAVPHPGEGLAADGSMVPRTDETHESVVIVTEGTIFNVTETNNG